MRFFKFGDDWIKDRRMLHKESSSKKTVRQIDKIKQSLPCSVSDSFKLLGIYFEINENVHFFTSSSIQSKREYDLFNECNSFAEQNNKEYYILVFDDDSPVLFRNYGIILFENEKEAEIHQKKINSLLETLHSNAIVKIYLFK
jgi:nuclear transport factor 2 (NTF2) superfamily protein